MTKERFSWKNFPNARKTVYRELAQKFGTIDTEAQAVKIRGSLGLHKDPSQDIIDLTRVIKILHFGKAHKGTPQAVGTQINWATTCNGLPGTERAKIKESYLDAFTSNVSEAHRQGFISTRFLQLPRQVEMEDGTTSLIKIKYNNGSYDGTLTQTVLKTNKFSC